jgi:hypothetical protein
LQPPNLNVQIAEGLIITACVRDKLSKIAERNIPNSARWHRMERMSFLCLFGPLGLIVIIHYSIEHMPLLVWSSGGLLSLGLLQIIERIQFRERAKRAPKVQALIEQLASERQNRIDDTLAFYRSAEWRLIRNKVINQQGRICRVCNRIVNEDFNLTVDHIKPRSKFPELALAELNLRVLCRHCNSSKGNTYKEVEFVIDG